MRRFHRHLRFMKIPVLLLMIGLIHTVAPFVYSQTTRLSFDLKDVTVKDVLDEIESNSEYYFLYSTKLIDVDRRISIRVKNEKISPILEELFRGENVQHYIMDGHIILSPNDYRAKKPDKVQVQNVREQDQIITGKVTDESGQPIPGVNVVVKGTFIGTTTGKNGNYILEVHGGDTLVFSFVGYKDESIEANGQQVINVILDVVATELEEVVAIGYGFKRKVNLTGAVDQVSASSLETRALGSVVDALQGNSANVIIGVTGYGGEPGRIKDLNIRGIGTLTGGGGKPYILVDGMPMEINDVDPRDIESISILKDAAASAVYGARAAYGVVLITTKQGKGRKRPVNLSYHAHVGWAHPTRIPDMTTSVNAARLQNYALENLGKAPQFDQEYMDKLQAYIDGKITDETYEDPNNPGHWPYYTYGYANNNHPKIFWDNWAMRQKHNLNISGTTEPINYYLSGGYYDEDGMLTWGDEYFKRYNFMANIDVNLKKWISLNLNSKYINSYQRRPKPGKGQDAWTMWFHTYNLPPSYPIYAPTGDIINHDARELEFGGKENHEENNLWLKIGSVIEPIKDWKTHISYIWNHSGNRIGIHEKSIGYPRVDGSLSEWRYPIPAYIEEYGEVLYNMFNMRTSYERTVGEHNFFAMVGFEREYHESRGLWGKKTGLITDNVTSISTATGEIYIDDWWSHWSTQGVFMRVSYNYHEKYLMEFNARYDGSSRFENARTQWGFFPSASVGYNISRESFWDPVEDLISLNFFKIRASYGSLGNQNVPNYLYMPILPVVRNLDWIFGDEKPDYTLTPDLISPSLTWETVNTVNFGYDAGLFSNRLYMNFDWFRRRTLNMLGPSEDLPAVLGTSPPQANNAELETEGFELKISWEGHITHEFNYSLKFILGDNKTTIVKYNNPTGYLGSWYKGQVYGDIWGYETVGFFQAGETVDDHADQNAIYNRWQAGDIKYKDLNEDGKIDWGDNTLENHGDLKIIGNDQPRYHFGFLSGMDYKGFDFKVFFQGVGKRDFMFPSGTTGNIFWGLGGKSGFNKQFFGVPQQDYWTPEGADHGGGPDAYFPRPYYGKEHLKNNEPQTKYLQNAAYIRLKNIELGYTIPQSLSRKMKINRARIYLSGENALLFTKMIETVDPENLEKLYWAGHGKTYPLPKLFSIGVNVDF